VTRDAGPVVGRGLRGAGARLPPDGWVVALLVVVAAALRLPGIAARGSWQADQGHDMLVLRTWVADGVVPLLGPPTSIGDVHHGALYYYLLGPAAWLGGGDPTAVVTEIAVLGILAVVATWWVARAISGPLAGALAGAIVALSPAAIEESTFIWNPNPIPLFAALAIGAAWRARQTGRTRWWVVALGATGVVMQLHVLGVVLLPPILGLAGLEWRRVRAGEPAGAHGGRRGMGRALAAGFGLVALGFVPLVIHELGHDFSEARHAIAYLTSDRPAAALDPISRFAFILFRAVGWPLVGLVTTYPAAAILAVAVTAVLVVWFLAGSSRESRLAVAWLLGTLVFSALVLTFLAPSLATVTPFLPNDHYHAFLDPVVAVMLAVATAALTDRVAAALRSLPRRTAPRDQAARPDPAPALATLVLAGYAVLAIPAWPPAVTADGGWPAALSAGRRVEAGLAAAGLGTAESVGLLGVPPFTGPDAIGYPLDFLGRTTVDLTHVPAATGRPEIVVIPCDRVFEDVVGARCGGAAEDAALARWLAGPGPAPNDPVASSLLDRFDLSSRTQVSVYRIPAAP
jgi:hypothetical protein